MMNLNSLIVQGYLESLKEDGELDSIFPVLLRVMGFHVISTPKDSKGQSQYGKDVIAIGYDDSGVKRKFYFEIKGESSKDIDARNFNADDGIRMSLFEAKDAIFKDSSIPQLNDLPIKVVLVHNGILKMNFRNQFEGFIQQYFKEGEFERWGIEELTRLFSQYLFNEYLLTDEESLKLFKKTLVLLDVPEYEFEDFYELVELQISKFSSYKKGRAFNKFFSTLYLLMTVVFTYSRQNDNLYPAKQCAKFLILKTWAWILGNGLERKKPVLTMT